MRSPLFRTLFLAAVVLAFSQKASAATEVKQASAPTTAVSQTTVSAPSVTNETAPTAKTDTLKITAVSQPFQVAAVSGDYHKYEAMTWQNRGYSGGIQDLSIQCASGDDVVIDASGSGIIGNGDYKGAYSITKKDVGYMDFDFKQFRKYYDTYGGIFQGLSDSLSRDLFLDVGHIGFEAGITMPDLPNVSVYYDHDYKTGSKSMLDWSTNARASSKKIAPSWEEINETVDTFGIKANHTQNGYHMTADQNWEMARWKTRGYEVNLSDTVGTGQDQIRQDQVQETNVMTTTLGADKWYLSDKIFASSAYRFQHLKNQDRQNIQQFTIGGGPRLTSTNKPDGSAHNNQDLNSWVLNLMVSPWSWLSGTTGFKAEVLNRDASSYYPNDTAGTIGVRDYDIRTNTESDTYKFAESFGLRFKAIPRAVFYADLSFEQSENHLKVKRTDVPGTGTSANDRMSRDAIVDEPVTIWTIGGDFQPLRFINLTSQFRGREKDMDFYDSPFRVVPGNARDGQVFLQWMHTNNIGFTQRATAHLSSWAQTSFRYLYDATDYTTRAVGDRENEKARMLSNTFIYDVSVFPASNLSMTGSLSQQLAETKTISACKALQIPAFTSNYYTWTFTTDYQPHKKVNLDTSLFYTIANNYGNNLSSNLVNYASAYDQLGLSIGCKWDINKDLSVKPQYGFQRYLPNEKSGIGGAYDAQIFSLAITTTWG